MRRLCACVSSHHHHSFSHLSLAVENLLTSLVLLVLCGACVITSILLILGVCVVSPGSSPISSFSPSLTNLVFHFVSLCMRPSRRNDACNPITLCTLSFHGKNPPLTSKAMLASKNAYISMCETSVPVKGLLFPSFYEERPVS